MSDITLRPPEPPPERPLLHRFAGWSDRRRYGAAVLDGVHTHYSRHLAARVADGHARVAQWAAGERAPREIAIAEARSICARGQGHATAHDPAAPLADRVGAAGDRRRCEAVRRAVEVAEARIAIAEAELDAVEEAAGMADRRWRAYYARVGALYARARSHRMRGARAEVPAVPALDDAHGAG